MQELAENSFFTEEEKSALPTAGLIAPSNETENRAVLAALLLASVVEFSMTDGATTTGEFEIIQEFIDKLEQEFELTNREQLEEIGTEMGMVPFISGDWTREQFKSARMILASALERLPEKNAHQFRAAIAKYVYETAKASGGLFKITNISTEEEHILHEIARTLKLQTTSEGMHLISRTTES